MDQALPASAATTLTATISALEGDAAVLVLQGSNQTLRWPSVLLPRGVGIGATVYLRALSAAALEDESDEVARKVLEQLLN